VNSKSQRRWRYARKARPTHCAYQPEHIASDHPVFHGILVAEDRLFQELTVLLANRGIDLITVMMKLQPGSRPEDYLWLTPGEPVYTDENYEDLRALLVYLHHDMLVRYLDHLDPLV
jgi:hypothetical protein